jgi:CheY-like chemotaxis protein
MLKEQLEAWKVKCQELDNIDRFTEALFNSLATQPIIPIIIWNIETLDQEAIKLLEQIKTNSYDILPYITLLIPFWEQVYFQRLSFAENFSYLTKPLLPSRLFEHLVKLVPKVKNSTLTIKPLSTQNNFPKKSDKIILVVEDDEINQMIIKKQLKYFGYNFDIVNNGEEALIAVKNKHYDLVLLDCHLSDLTSIAVTSEIRKQEHETLSVYAHHLPIIALTVNNSFEELEKCRAVGIDDLLTKPISTETLAEVFKRWC